MFDQQQNPRLYFYRHNRQVNQIQGTSALSLLVAEELALAQLRHEQGSTHTTALATDTNHSVFEAVKASGTPHRIAYLPYGFCPQSPHLPGLPGFNGEMPDPMTGHYLLGAGYRMYNTVLMRFHSPDSWSPFGEGGLSSYGYVQGDPINNSDPSGHVKKFSYSGPGRLLGKKTLYFESLEDGNRVGNLDMHGDVELVSFDGQTLNGRELKSALIKKNIELADLDQFRIISCHSADGDMSVGRLFANATGLKTIAFAGRVYPTDMKLQPTKGNDKVNLENYSLATTNSFHKSHPEYKHFKYSPTIFTPEEVQNKNKNKNKNKNIRTQT
jgi:RHS repeat-associated protein